MDVLGDFLEILSSFVFECRVCKPNFWFCSDVIESEWCALGGVETWVLFNFCAASGVVVEFELKLSIMGPCRMLKLGFL